MPGRPDLIHRPALVPLALLCAASLAHAQNDTDHVLDEVVVSAAGFEQKLTDAPASISVISAEELRQRPYTSLVDAVRELEGVDIDETTDKTGQRSISLRGMGADYTLVLINGRRQNNHGNIYPNAFGGNQFNHIPPLDAIERIEVIRGPASTLYGADAMGGVINIITKKIGDEWRGSLTLGRTLQGDSDFGDDTTADFHVSGPLRQDMLGLSVRGSFYDKQASNPDFAPVQDPAGNWHTRTMGFGGGAGRTVANTNKSLGLSLTLTPTSRQTLTLDLDTSRQEYDNSNSQLGTLDSAATIWRASGGTVQPRVGYTREQKFSRESWALTHAGEWDFGHSQVSLSYVESSNDGRSLPFSPSERERLQELWDGSGAYAGQSEAERRAEAERTFLPRPRRTLESRQYTLDAKLDIPLRDLAGDHMLVVGGQYIDGELKDGVFGLERGRAAGIQEHKMYSLFIEDNWMPTDRLTLTGGLRHDDHDIFGSHVSPRLYAVYTLTPAWTLKGGVSTGYKTPLTTDLYDGITGFGNQGVTPIIGNPGLKPEESVNSEIALYWNHPERHSFNVTLFKNRFKNKIQTGASVPSCTVTGGARPCANLGDYAALDYTAATQKVNVARADITGAEIAARFQVLPKVGLRANYTFTDSEQKTGEYAGQPLTNTARHMLNLTADWQATPDLNTYLTMEYRSRRYRGNDTTIDEHLYYKGYTQLHLGANYAINDTFTLTARINNLLDRDFTRYRTVFTPDGNGGYTPTYVDSYNNKDRARSFWVSLNARF